MKRALALILSCIMVVLLMFPAMNAAAADTKLSATCIEWCGGDEKWGSKEGITNSDWNAACFT